MRYVIRFTPVNILLAVFNSVVAMMNMGFFVKRVVDDDNAMYIHAACVIVSSLVAVFCLTEKE